MYSSVEQCWSPKSFCCFRILFNIISAVLAIIVSGLQNNNTKKFQKVNIPFTKNKSITPELHTSPGYVDRIHEETYNEECIHVKRIHKNLGKNYQVRLRNEVRILIEKEIATQTPEACDNSPNSQLSLREPPSLTSTDISEDEILEEENPDEIYKRQILFVLKESIYDLFKN